MIRDTFEKVNLIRKSLLTAQSRQKSYAEKQRRPLEFEVSDHVFLKVMPKSRVVKFRKRGKLAPRNIGPFEVLDMVSTIAYWLTLPPNLSSVHEVFHISMLQTYTPDPAHVVDWGEIVVDTDGTFEEGPVPILDSRDQVLRSNTCDAPKPGGPLTTRQPAEYKWMSGYPTPLQKIGQSLLCTGSSTHLQNLHLPVPNSPIYAIYPIT